MPSIWKTLTADAPAGQPAGHQTDKSLLLLFFKKEGLFSFFFEK
jgi:hypothetical protein